VAMSLTTNPAHDDIMSRPALASVVPLLNASGGVISRQGYMKNQAAWRMAVNFEKLGAHASHKVAAPVTGQPWGYKSPRQIFMLPAMDEAFSSAVGPASTLQLVVARDPRDICTGSNLMEFKMYASSMGFAVDGALYKHQQSDCLLWWGELWGQVLPSLGGEAVPSASITSRIAVVRIEDLVGAPINTSAAALRADEITPVVRCMLKLLGIQGGSAFGADLQAQVAPLQEHVSSYGGGKKHATEQMRDSIELLVASHDSVSGGSFRRVHAAMAALGYNIGKYGRGTPAAREVLTASHCLPAHLA